jgi:hypothetical protein
MPARTRLDDEVIELLADDPELLAIADAVAETQTRRRRVRPVGIAACAALVCVVAAVVALWPGGGSSGISGNTAYAAVGGSTRTLEMRLLDGPRTLRLRYDRSAGQLSVIERGQTLRLPSASLPPAEGTLAPSLQRRFGSDFGPVLSLITEYPAMARDGHLSAAKAPGRAWTRLEWVRYRSALGYAVEVGLRPVVMTPIAVTRAGSGTVVPLVNVYSTN